MRQLLLSVGFLFDLCDSGNFVETKIIWKAPTRTEVGDYCLKLAVPDKWLCSDVITGQHEPKQNLSP